MSNLKYRLLIVGLLVAASIVALWPRTTIERVERDGVFAYDTVKRFPVKRGLDLRGGMHLALEVDQSQGTVADPADAIARAERVVRSRIDEFGVAEPLVQRIGETRLIVELPGIDDPERAIEVVQQSAFLQFQITDRTQALERVAPRLDAIARDLNLAVGGTADGDTARSSPIGLEGLLQADSSADSTSSDSSATQSQGASTGPFQRSLQVGQLPGQYFVSADDEPLIRTLLAREEIRNALPPGKQVKWGADSLLLGAGEYYRPLYVLDSRPIITGEYLVDARPNQDGLQGTVVEFQLNNEGGRRFRTETGRHVGDYMAIVLDDRVMSAPVIQSAIGTRGQITLGGSTLQEAQDLALVLRAGSLPVPLSVVDMREIGPSLGQDAVQQGIRAGILGVILVILIMITYYRFSGFLAVIGLGLFALFTMAMLAGLDAVLTLPGIAGFVLSIGMAVDANFLIFERIREELDAGRTVRAAVDSGFQNALSAIIDSNVTTALTAAVLYQFGTGPVRGFAVTLIAGLAASMVTAIFVVRTFYLVWLSRQQNPQTLSI
ncbi:MAG TPA: protein translocase subunit SecD [Gemmatimonadales bacterium]|nr:protein translocase subunit SecD [Gemmatimonadales bacterium]